MCTVPVGCSRPGMVMVSSDPGLCLYNGQINAICTQTAYMLRTIFIMRTKSLLPADKSCVLFAASGHGRGWPDSTGSRQGTQGRCCGPGRLSLQIFKKKRTSPREITVNYDVLETVDIIDTVNKAPGCCALPCAAEKWDPKIFPKNKKSTFEDCTKTAQ